MKIPSANNAALHPHTLEAHHTVSPSGKIILSSRANMRTSTAASRQNGRLPQGSFEESGDRLHGKEKAILAIGKRDEVEVLVKPDGARIDRVDNDGNGSNLGRLGECAVQGVHEEKLAKALSCIPLINGEASQKRDRNIRVGGKFPGDVLWQIREINGERREGVIAEDGPVIGSGDKNEWGGDVPARLLPGELFQVLVENRVAAGERGPVMLSAKRFNEPLRWLAFSRHL